MWWSTYQQILKRIGQPCFRTVLHGLYNYEFGNFLLPLFLVDKLLIQWPKAKGQTMIYKTPHRKSKIVQHEPDLKPGVRRSRYTSETRRITD